MLVMEGLNLKMFEYDDSSWESVTRTIKKSLGINCLTQPQAKTILALYIRGVGVKEIIKQLEETK